MSDFKLPEDSDSVKHVRSSYAMALSLAELIEYSKKFFPNTDFNDIKIDKEEIQEKCFGYDLYDSSDYGWYYVFYKE